MKTVANWLSLLLLSTSIAVRGSLVDDNAIYVNALGQEVIPQSFEWGRIAVKEKNAAKMRHCGMIDGSGRLGRRQTTCPDGYTATCTDSASFPCCPTNSPQCCPNSNVCCGADQICQGTSTCCSAGQTGCGEACCNSGETCCGSNCCSAGYTCSSGNCVAPSGVTSTPSITDGPGTTAPVRAATGSATVLDTGAASRSASTTSSSTTQANNNNNSNNSDNSINVPHGPSPATLGGAIGGSLGGLTTIIGIILAWWGRQKQKAKKALEALKKDAENVKPPPTVTSSVKEKEEEEIMPYEPTSKEETWVERPALISAAVAGHGSAYT